MIKNTIFNVNTTCKWIDKQFIIRFVIRVKNGIKNIRMCRVKWMPLSPIGVDEWGIC